MMTEDRNAAEARDLMKQVEDLHPACFTWALHCCDGNRSEAEEVLQTVYLKILDGRAAFGGRSSLKTWLFAVVRATASERRRRLLRQIRRLADWLGNVPGGEKQSPLVEVYEAELRMRISVALAGLSPRQREIARLVFYHDLTVEEASGVMGVSVGSGRVHYERAKAGLRRQLEGQYDRARRTKDQAALF